MNLQVAGIALLIAAGLGFGAGRVKNSKKLAAVHVELLKLESEASAEVKALVAKIKSLL